MKALWCLLGVAALALVAGCTELPPCPDDDPTVLDIPGGEFAPADTYRETSLTETPFFSGTFPRGVLGGAGSAGAPDPPHGDMDFASAPEPVPTAKLEVDRELGIVRRSYVDDYGRMISEIDNVTNYIQFHASRVESDATGREQRDDLYEFYPSR